MSVARRSALAPVALLVGVVVLMLAPTAQAKTPKLSAGCETSSESITKLIESEESVPAELSSPLEAVVLSRFAILRRAALPSDQIPALSPVGGEIDGELVSYYPGYVRQLKVFPNGSRYFMIPGFAKPQNVPPTRCLPVSERHDHPALVEQEHKLAAEPVYCIVAIGHESGGAQCEPFAEIEQSPRVFTPSLSEAPVIELIPDGVASVRVTYLGGSSVLAPVDENEYSFTMPAAVRSRAKTRFTKDLRRLTDAKHKTKAQKRRVLEELLAALDKTLVEAEPRKVEWLGSAGELLHSSTPPKTSATIVGVNLATAIGG